MCLYYSLEAVAVPGGRLTHYFFYRNGNEVGPPGLLESSLVLSQADVAGEVHGTVIGTAEQASTSRMPGTATVPESFTDIHIYNNRAGQHWGTPDGFQNDDPAGWGASAGVDAVQIWDKTC
jgi:hypothetical protein